MGDDKALIDRLVMEYAHACKRVMDALNAAGERANLAVRARSLATDPTSLATDPTQHQASRDVFGSRIGRYETEFSPLYEAFEVARGLAKEAGARLIGACQESDPDAELRDHLLMVDPPLLDTVAAAVICMRAPFRPGPAKPFMDAIQEANAAMASEPYFGQPGFNGFIYRGSPGAPVQPGPSSVADELEKLASLRDRGVLTDTEFAAQKAKLLGS